MIRTIKTTDPAVNRLIAEYCALRSLDKLADKYGVNPRYVWDLLRNGVYPPGRIRRKLGMEPPPTPFQIARDGMAAETRVAVRRWKIKVRSTSGAEAAKDE